MPSSFDLDAYLARIDYTGPREASLAALAQIHYRHVCSIPFENLDILLGRPIRIDPSSVQQKLIHDRRGGYCFEHNTLFAAALTALGFRVTPLAARVRWQVPAEVKTALTHMILAVEATGRHLLADTGFGSGSLSAPLLLDTDAPQPTPHERRRLLRRGDVLVHQAEHAGAWADLYEFTLQPMFVPDFEMGNWFTSTWPESRFRQNLTVALTAPDRRHTLLNRQFTTRWTDGRVETRELATPAELLEVLGDFFALTFPAGTRFDAPGLASSPVSPAQ